MKFLTVTSAIIGSTAFLAACTSTGYTERNAAAGAAAGAVAGAVIGNNTGNGDAGTGAAVGAALGGLAGAAKGCSESADCDTPGVKDQPDEKDSDGDGYVDAVDRYPYDSRRW